MRRSLAWVLRAPKDDLWLPPLTTLTCNEASDKEYDKYFLSLSCNLGLPPS